MGSKKNLLFYIGTLQGGGAEKVLIQLLKSLNRDKYQLFIALNRPEGKFFDLIPKDVKIIDRSVLYRQKFSLFQRYFGLSKIIKEEKIDLVLSFLTGANRSLMRSVLFLGNDVNLFLSEHNNPLHTEKEGKNFIRQYFEKKEIKFFYPKADKIIVVSKGLRKHILRKMKLDSNKVQVIYNMINFDEIEKLSEEPIQGLEFNDDLKTIVAAGRLTEQKAYPDMLKVFKNVQESVRARLIILGEGPDRDKIQRQIQSLSLVKSVFMPGFVDNPFAFFSKADLYLSTSHWEGFHLTIAEAMACGTVPVATDCDYGPREIINNGENGYLVPVGDVNAISLKVVEALKKDKQRKLMSIQSKKRAAEFDLHHIINEYEMVFDKFLNN